MLQRLSEVSRSYDFTGEVLFDLSEWIAETLRLLGPHFEEIIREGFRFGSLRIDIEQNIAMDHPDVRRILDAINEKSRRIPETSLEALNETIQDALRENKSTDELARDIAATFEGFADRAQVIAETSVAGGFNGGQAHAFKQAGITKKGWGTQRDGQVREAHVAADGQEVGITERFIVDGESLDHPGDPEGSAGNVIRCRCDCYPVI